LVLEFGAGKCGGLRLCGYQPTKKPIDIDLVHLRAVMTALMSGRIYDVLLETVPSVDDTFRTEMAHHVQMTMTFLLNDLGCVTSCSGVAINIKI